MPKKTSGPAGTEGIILQKSMEEILHESMLPYAEYVILERALPRAEDGLKPVQRRILYTMQELSMTPDKPHRKSARIVGDCLGKYHPHGDSSVYDAMVRMAQSFNMRGVLVDGHGNFGSIDGDTAAAMRYTEARMTPLAMELLRDINKDTVDHQWNFDDTLEEPCVLPARFPNLLVNGASGIAVGLATNIPPHNLRESVEAVIAQIDNPDITTDQLMQIIPGPDFPTGGILLHSNEIKNAYETGRGRLLVRAKVDVEKEKNGKQLLVITEVPYQVNKAAMLEKILKLSEEKKGPLAAISDIRDESDRDGLRAVIELKKDADAQLVLAYLYKYSDLQVTFGVNIVAIAGGRPHQMGLKAVIGHYISHQKDVVTRRTRYDLENAKKRAHILEGLIIALNDLDRAIALIRGSKDGPSARAALMEAFSLTEIQAQAILDLRLQRLTNLEILTLRKEHEEVLALIGELESILSSEKKLMKLIKKELTVVMNQYADERRTVILKEEPIELPDITKQQAAPEEACVLMTSNGFIKRVAPRYLQKPEDFADDPPRETILTDTSRRVMFFTDLGNVYTVNVPSITECRPKDRGMLPAALLEGLEDNERLIRMFGTDDQGEYLFVTKKGQIKRTLASEYGIRKGKLAAIKLRTGDSLLYVEPLLPEHSMMLISKTGMSIHFMLDEVPVNGRVSGGVRGIQLDIGDEVKAAMQIQSEGEILLISDRGYAKRNLIIDHDPQGRGGKGLKAFIFNRNGSNGSSIAGAIWVRDPAELLIRQANGEATRLLSEEVMIEQRASKGTPMLMALMDNVVVSIGREGT